MAFVKKGLVTQQSTTSVTQVDSSQLGKIAESGYTVTPVSNNPKDLSGTTPVSTTLLPNTKVDGYQDTKGNFFVVDQNNTVHSITPTVTTPTDSSNPIKPTIIIDSFNPTVSNGGGGSTFIPTSTPTTQTPVLPPNNLGSGKIYSRFEAGDIVPNQQETVTRALWSNNVGNLLTYHTSSLQNSTQQRYYYEIYNSASGQCGAEAQFSVAWGHKQGSGSADEGGQINDTPSRAIYGQYKQLCLDPDVQRFVIGGTATDNIYAINVARARMRESIDEGNLEINLQRLSGSQWLTGGNAQNAWTGSNVRVFPTQAVLRLIDDSRVESATITSAGEVYNIVSGTLEDGIYNSTAPHYYGLLYKRLGIVILDGNTLDMSSSFLTVTGSEIPGDNAYKMFLSLSGSAKYTDASGDYLGFQGRSSEKVKSTHFFVRVKNQDYNFSNNPTFVTGSEGDLAEPTMIGNPKVYVTTVGLYNDNKDLLAVAKTSKAIQKSFTTEALIKVRVDWVWIGFLMLLNLYNYA